MPIRKRHRVDSSYSDSSEDRQSGTDSPSPRSPSPELRDNLSARELYQVKKTNDARKELRAAERQLADITNQHDAAPRRGRKKRKVLDGGSEDETKEVKNLAHKFTIMKLLWVSDLDDTVNTDINEQYNPLERFENHESKVQGELADLLETLPEKFRGEVICAEWFIKTFHTAMGTQRSNTAGRIRRECGPEIYDCTAADLASAESRRDKFRDRIGYVKDAKGDSKYEAFNVDLLHKDYKGSFDIDTVFRGPALHLAFAGIIRGAKSVTAMKQSNKPIQATGKCVAQLWHLKNSTAGCIAGTAVVAASADIELTPIGAETGINWQADFEKYVKYLLNGLHKRKASVLKIFREWDEIFFPDTDSSLAATDGVEDCADKHMQDVMDLLNAGEEEVPETN
ncbi:hypothetical protein C8R45DRAFT_1075505 [Mycena sanguinolenta]|nr:hypothetical protein C8R45DRAFT_1075505 [Mycena sanguinolenta]